MTASGGDQMTANGENFMSAVTVSHGLSNETLSRWTSVIKKPITFTAEEGSR
jgi:hypothetical protein